jgi:hypothetical protein
MGGRVAMIFTDVNLAGKIDGVELAHFTTQCYPNIHAIGISGLALKKSLPKGATFMPKPWRPLAFAGLTPRSRRAGGRCVRPE